MRIQFSYVDTHGHSPWHLLFQALLDALRAIAHSPTGTTRGTLPCGLVETTPGNVHDGDVFGKVVDAKSQMVTADKAYDSKKNHRLLKKKKKTSAIIIKKNRKSKRLKKQQMKAEVQAAQRERPKIERKFAELKRFHGLTVARYWGLTKMAIQNLMVAICCNLKRMVKLIFLACEGKPLVPLKSTEGIPVPI